MNNKKIGKFICGLRKEINWTQEDLANHLAVDRTIISKWERGIYIPGPEFLLKLQDLFNVSINEILYGEKRNSDNDKNIDSVPAEIINTNNKKIKKYFIITCIIFLFTLFLFFIYYFINNYNSINIYTINGSNDSISLDNGLLIVSRDKAYLKLSKLTSTNNIDIHDVTLYYKKNNKQEMIFKGGADSTEYLYTNRFNYNELFPYKDLKYIINYLYLDIRFENESVVNIKLNVKRDFANNKLFGNKKLKPITDETESKNIDFTPKYIKDNFKLNKKNEKYYFTKKYNNYKEEQSYFYNVHLFLVYKKYSNYEEKFEYTMYDNLLEHYYIKNNQIDSSFVYNIKNNTCEIGKCDKEIIRSFKENYYNKYIK